MIITASTTSYAKYYALPTDNTDFGQYIDSSLALINEVRYNDLNQAIQMTDRLIKESLPYENDSITNYLKFKFSLYHLLYGNAEQCKQVTTEIMDYYKHHDIIKYAILLNRMCHLEIKFGNYAQAMDNAEQALAILKDTDKYLSLGLVYTYLSNIYIQKTDYNQAYKYADLALASYSNRPDRIEYIATAKTLFAQINLLIKDYAEAKRYFAQVFASADDIKDQNFLVRPILYYGILKYEEGHYGEAKELFEKGLDQIKQLGDFPDLSLVYQCMHKIAIAEKKYNKAETYINEAINHADKALNLREQFISKLLYQQYQANYPGHTFDSVVVHTAYDWALQNGDYEILKMSNNSIAQHLIKNQSFQKALDYQSTFLNASEKILQTEKLKEINLFKEKTKIQQELLAKESAEKELKLQLASQNRIRKLMILSLVISMILLSASYYFYRVMKKAYSKLQLTNQELKNAETVLDDKNKELEKYIESNIQLSQFAHIASHDLKSPLRTIGSFTGLLKHKIKSVIGKKELSYFSYIEEATAGLSNLVDDLLKFSTINSQSIELESINVKLLIEEVVKNISYNIEQSQADIQLQAIPKFIYADSMQLKQVFQNLLTNAIKFMPADQVPMIHISADKVSDYWQFKIKDNGIGIDPKYASKIFKDFARLHNNESYKGTGMGLAICKKIIDKHGGRIWVESRLGQGCTFLFTIPQ